MREWGNTNTCLTGNTNTVSFFLGGCAGSELTGPAKTSACIASLPHWLIASLTMSSSHACGNEHSLDAVGIRRYDPPMTQAAPAADPSYPVGKFARSASITPAVRHECVEELARLPERIVSAVRGLTLDQLDTPYRAGGWTARQVVHHVADSHMNAFIRMRSARPNRIPRSRPTTSRRGPSSLTRGPRRSNSR